jgi:phosphatidylglycerophosphatase A
MVDRIKLLLCTGGLGLLPKAPGTWGSLAPLFILLTLGHFAVPQRIIICVLIVIILGSAIISISLAPWYTLHFGKKDPAQVVCDEWAGQSIALLGMAWLEPSNQVSTAIWIGLAICTFVLFRIFDIWKPSLIDKAQQFRGGWGVLMDDVFAGTAAGILTGVLAVVLS